MTADSVVFIITMVFFSWALLDLNKRRSGTHISKSYRSRDFFYGSIIFALIMVANLIHYLIHDDGSDIRRIGWGLMIYSIVNVLADPKYNIFYHNVGEDIELSKNWILATFLIVVPLTIAMILFS